MRLPSVLVHHALCRELDEAAHACSGQPESGGILLGCYRGGDLEVTGRTVPGPADGRYPFAFVRVDGMHQSAATAAWSGSGGTRTWVGEWHTHPSGGVSPSSIDRREWSRLARSAGQAMVFALVVPGEWGLFVVLPSMLRCRVLRLPVTETGATGRVFCKPR